MLRTLLNYQGFILGSVKREFELKYKSSMLGAAWSIIHPLSLVIVYTLIFSQVMGARLPGVNNPISYSIYLCSGLLTWNYFVEVLSRAQNTFIENGALIKKLSFPKICLPVVLLISATINFAIIFVIFILFLVLFGYFPGVVILAILPVLMVQVLFAIGLGITLGVLNVFFRDIGQLFSVFIQFWFWATPIVYPINVLPQWFKNVVDLNPMTAIIRAYQDIILSGGVPDIYTLLPSLLLGLIFCFIGILMFRKHVGEMVDEL